jgi:hypothetical protein
MNVVAPPVAFGLRAIGSRWAWLVMLAVMLPGTTCAAPKRARIDIEYIPGSGPPVASHLTCWVQNICVVPMPLTVNGTQLSSNPRFYVFEKSVEVSLVLKDGIGTAKAPDIRLGADYPHIVLTDDGYGAEGIPVEFHSVEKSRGQYNDLVERLFTDRLGWLFIHVAPSD